MTMLTPDWFDELSLQKQAVLLMALRGPDGDVKHTLFKHLLRALRACCIKSAHMGRMLRDQEAAGSYMTLAIINKPVDGDWRYAINSYLDDEADAANLHVYTHFMHAAQVLAHHHPDYLMRERWAYCYALFADRLHLNIETTEQFNARLDDYGRVNWELTEV